MRLAIRQTLFETGVDTRVTTLSRMESKGIEGEVLKIGASEGHSVNEIDAAILKALGKTEVAPQDRSGPARTRAAACGRHGEGPLKASLETVPILCERAPGNRSVVTRTRSVVESDQVGPFSRISFDAVSWPRRKVISVEPQHPAKRPPTVARRCVLSCGPADPDAGRSPRTQPRCGLVASRRPLGESQSRIHFS